MSASASDLLPRVSEATVRAHIGGGVSGQVAVGNHINQVGSVHGDLIVQQQHAPRVAPRPRPLDRRPSPFPNLLGRESAVAAALGRLRAGDGAGFYGTSGVGKSSALRHVAHSPEAPETPDGVLYCPGRGQPLIDLLQLIFDGFYDADLGFTPTPGQVHHYLSSVAALVMIDDLALTEQEVGILTDTLPRCTFLLTSEERFAWEPGRSSALPGLSEAAALALLERELERSLAPEEDEPARALWKALDGHPRRLVQAAATVSDQRRKLAEVAAAVASGPVEEVLARQAIAGMTVRERDVLDLIAAVEPAALPVERVALITGYVDSDAVLEALRSKALVKAHSPRYSLTMKLPAEEQAGRSRWAERAVDYYLDMLDAGRRSPERFAEDIDPLRALVAWAMGESRWKDVLRLVQRSDPVLAVARRWEARNELIRQALSAARSLGDSAAIAWCYHQLGTRALWLGDQETAWYRLSRALELRRSLGDDAGADVTQFHLDQLGPGPGEEHPPHPNPSPPGSRGPRSRARGVVVMCLLVLVVGAVFLANGRDREELSTVVAIGASAVEVKPSRLSFDARRVGTTSSPRTVTLTSKGPGLVVARGASVHGEDFAIIGNGCRDQIAVGSSCRIRVTFTPSESGSRLAALVVDTEEGALEVTLEGTGSAGTAATIAPPRSSSSVSAVSSSSVPGESAQQESSVPRNSLNADRSEVFFGDVNIGSSSKPVAIVVRNAGSASVDITSIVASGAGSEDFEVSYNCPSPVRPSESCEILVSFSPTSPGLRVASLLITADDVPPLAVALNGTGLGAQLELTPAWVAFSDTEVGMRSAPRTITITNTGTEPARIESRTGISDPFSVESDTCFGATLEPDTSCTITVVFAPTKEGFAEQPLSYGSDAATLVATLTGTAPSSPSTTIP